MITREMVHEVLDTYGEAKPTIGSVGSHSALDISDGAKDEGFDTVVVCQKGRELPYKAFKRIVDEVILLERFADIVRDDAQAKLRGMCTIFVPHRHSRLTSRTTR